MAFVSSKLSSNNKQKPTFATMRSLFLLSLVSLFQSSLALKILLTNEDGIDHAGIKILRDALIEKGHKVYTFAPKKDMTGMGGSLDMPKVKVEQVGDAKDNVWAVDGYPASALLVGLAMMDQEPDLVSLSDQILRTNQCD